MKKNQKILYALVLLCIITQYVGLVFRLIYNGHALNMNLSIPDYSKAIKLVNQNKIVLFVASAIENACVVFQTVNIIIVLCFMQNLL